MGNGEFLFKRDSFLVFLLRLMEFLQSVKKILAGSRNSAPSHDAGIEPAFPFIFRPEVLHLIPHGEAVVTIARHVFLHVVWDDFHLAEVNTFGFGSDLLANLYTPKLCDNLVKRAIDGEIVGSGTGTEPLLEGRLEAWCARDALGPGA